MRKNKKRKHSTGKKSRNKKSKFTLEERLVGRTDDTAEDLAHDGVLDDVERRAAVLGVDVEPREVARLGRPSVSVCQSAQTFQTFGDDGREPLLSGQFRDEEHVLWRVRLVAPVGPTWRQKFTIISSTFTAIKVIEKINSALILVNCSAIRSKFRIKGQRK